MFKPSRLPVLPSASQPVDWESLGASIRDAARIAAAKQMAREAEAAARQPSDQAQACEGVRGQ